MSEQNNYRISWTYKSSKTEEWRDSHWLVDMADNWQDAIHTWLENWGVPYQVVSETPSEDSKSGIIEIQFDPPQRLVVGAKIKATPQTTDLSPG